MKNLKLIYVMIIMVTALFLLMGCFSKYEVTKENVRWTADNEILEFTIEGIDPYYGSGTFKLDDEYIKVAIFFGMPRIKLYVFDETAYVKWMNTGYDDSAMIIFSGKVIDKKNNKLRFKTENNNTGQSFYDDLEFTMTRTDLDKDEYDAANHINSHWQDEELNLSFKRDKTSIFIKKAFGSIELSEEKIDAYLLFKDNYEFEIYELSSKEPLLLKGTYEISELFTEEFIHYHLLTLTIEESTLIDFLIDTKIILKSKYFLE